MHGSPPWRSGLNPIEVKGWYSDGAIPVGTLFDLTVFGRLPTSDYKEFDASHAMRLKIVPYTASSTCDDPIPPQVSGIGCEDLVYEAPESAQAGVFVHGSETTTLCAPGPAEARGHGGAPGAQRRVLELCSFVAREFLAQSFWSPEVPNTHKHHLQRLRHPKF